MFINRRFHPAPSYDREHMFYFGRVPVKDSEYRVPVGVTLNVSSEGVATPTSIVWNGGRRVFPIVGVMGKPLKARDPETGDAGWCYAVTIVAPHKAAPVQRRLYRYGPRWYVYCRRRPA